MKLEIEYNPNPKQTEFHCSSAKYRLFLGAWRSGKCLYVKQGVRMADGSIKQAQDIRAGDKILGYNRETCKAESCSVLSTEKTLKKTERYILSDNSEIICSPDHRFPCSWQGYDKEKEIGEIARRTKGNISKGYYYLLGVKKVNFLESKTPFKISPYILGLLLGDGCMVRNEISFSTPDKELLTELRTLDSLEIKKRSEYDYGIVSKEKDAGGRNFNWLVTELRELGLLGKNSHTKFIPEKYLYSTEKDRKEILSGLVDTDGSVRKDKKGSIEYSTCSIQLAEGVQFILRTLGIRATVNRRTTKSPNGNLCLSYRLTWTDKNSVNLRIKRKRDLLGIRKLHRSHRVYIKEYYDFGIQECVDIAIDYPSHLFLLDNFIATHNTWAGCKEALKQSMLYPNNRGLIGRKNYTDLRDTTMRTFFEVCLPELIKSYNKTEHHLCLINGSEVFFRELKDRSGLGSFELGWFYIDEAEEVQESIFTYLKGRLNASATKRQCGWLTSNPPNKDHWLFNAFESGNANHYSIHANTYQNKKHLPDSYISELESLPESWRKKYLMGEYGFTPDGKPFYDGFKDSLHRRLLNYIKGKTIYRGIDFGFHHPFCVWGQVDANDRFMVLKELMGADITIDKFADRITLFENEHFPDVEFKTFYDPAGEQVSDKNEQTSVEILKDKGITGSCKQSTYRERKELMEQKLSTLIAGIPALIADESCHVIIDGFLGGYHYPEAKDGKPVEETPFRDGYYEHGLNALEYIIVNLFNVRKKKPSRPQFTGSYNPMQA